MSNLSQQVDEIFEGKEIEEEGEEVHSLEKLMDLYQYACELSWTSNYGVDYFKKRLSIELSEKLMVDVEVRDLIGKLSHKHNM